ncbi:response regulator [Candidatus Saccharibacteria bacterium]|nr:response regulator [Candidatus Saccharibacteria bacterium]
MSKIMVVEDDASLREIYSIRITAEGYEVVSAGDGEEALAMAVREKPDLILSDVMMPKISGFDMLDILRSTPETAGIKVIMMTALSADDQRARGERLGAERYLVKSQVGIEDVVNAIHEVLGDKPVPAPAPAAPVPTAAPANPAPAPAAPAQAAPQPAPQSQVDHAQPTNSAQ